MSKYQQNDFHFLPRDNLLELQSRKQPNAANALDEGTIFLALNINACKSFFRPFPLNMSLQNEFQSLNVLNSMSAGDPRCRFLF